MWSNGNVAAPLLVAALLVAAATATPGYYKKAPSYPRPTPCYPQTQYVTRYKTEYQEVSTKTVQYGRLRSGSGSPRSRKVCV